MIYDFDHTDFTGMSYHDLLPEKLTSEEKDEYLRLTMRMSLYSMLTFFGLLVAIAILGTFTSCASVQKTEHTEQTHVVRADSAGSEQIHAVQVREQTVNIDSIVTVAIQRTREEMARQEQEHEITTETLTETIDSLGRIVRQQQRVTDRTMSRQEQQRIDRMEQTFKQQLQRAIQEQDSLWQQRFAQYQATMNDSLSLISDKQRQRSASNPLTWWQQVRIHIANILLWTLAVVAVVFVFRRWISKKK